MSRSLQRQLQEAFEASQLTLEDLLKLSGLEIDATSLSRKLSGKQSLRTTECEALAKALRIVVSTGKGRGGEKAA